MIQLPEGMLSDGMVDTSAQVKLYRLSDAAAMLGISRNTVYKYVQKGIIHGVKIGREWRIRTADLEAYIQRSGSTYSLDDVCAMLDVSRVTAKKYIDAGDLKAEKVGKCWEIRHDDLIRFIDSR